VDESEFEVIVFGPGHDLAAMDEASTARQEARETRVWRSRSPRPAAASEQGQPGLLYIRTVPHTERTLTRSGCGTG